MSRDMNQTRSDKFEKRRKSTKAITIGIIAASILVIILLGIWVFGGSGGEERNADENENSSSDEDSDFLITEPGEEEEENNNSTDNEENGQDEENDSTEENNDNNEQANEQNNNVETESVEPSDENVSEAYTGNWEPIGTEQEGPHTTTYDDGSQDRIEIKEATSMVTGINPENMVEWRVENGGDQKVVATVSNMDETQVFRVYLQWIDGEGWQPTKVEELIENDKK
ncbi:MULTISPECIES: YrrS family protein [unclassified Oceanobacillus]|uniref:YrrS family protein n=1 Tax=unclassified Oceanobacillus TaxID=2630292 RepID=UPI001BE86B42|nr:MULTISPECIES: YrrS family protein [unclassified Oceanobacillus]MBT2598245.1 YrrS family protein [Oceanobacillus sp. ISL-74]MBT2651164.1 YrrS family protein [Oceanobacillus sp. ISL-73]